MQLTPNPSAAGRSAPLWREWRWSYLPPLMVYLAAGIQGLTGIVGTFFVKEYLDLSAEFLAALGFWLGIPWALKMPIGHLVDVVWRQKAWLVVFGASLITASLLIMAALIGARDTMAALWSVNGWFVLSALLAPIGYVVQDAVADAMTAEAVPRVDHDGTPLPPERIRAMHVTMQTLGRVALIGGTVLVALINLVVFADAGSLSASEKVATYRNVYLMALAIPVVSVLGIALQAWLQRQQLRGHMARGLSLAQARALIEPNPVATAPNAWILGGSLVFVVFTVSVGLSGWPYNQELIFIGSLAIVGFLMLRLVNQLSEAARRTLLGTALVVFMFRATPGTGAGVSWWSIDVLGFDQAFFSVLSLVASCLTLVGMLVFRRFMAERSIFYITGWLTLAGFLLALPNLGMSLGLHEWTAARTNGVVDARFIALIDTALESPLGQISMIPLLAWIANAAPAHLKATYFAVMTSFANLALSAGQLGTKYLNQWFVITREVRDPNGAISVAANYSELPALLATAIGLGLLLPLAAIAVAMVRGWRSA